MNGITPKVIGEVAKHPLVAVVIITLALLYMIQGMVDSQDERLDKQVEVMGTMSESLIHIQNGQNKLIKHDDEFLKQLEKQTEILQELSYRLDK